MSSTLPPAPAKAVSLSPSSSPAAPTPAPHLCRRRFHLRLRLENAWLKDELDCICALVGKFIGCPSPLLATAAFPSLPFNSLPLMGLERSIERLMQLELALAAMDELLKLAQTDYPIWLPGLDGNHGNKETINYEEYLKVFPRCIGPKPVEYVTETSRET